MNAASVRMPAVAGLFYPAAPDSLRAEVSALLHRPSKAARPVSPVVGLITPHAGYQYSGATAADAYRLLAGIAFDAAVIVSPSHREYFDGVSVYGGRAYRTPFGDMEVDDDLRRLVCDFEPLVEPSSHGHRDEHAVEVHLPFLQVAAGMTRILPIVMGDQRRDYCFRLGRALGRALAGRNVLLVASTDLSHYHAYDVAERLDRILIDDIGRFDPERMMTDLEEERAEACGGGPTVATLVAARDLGADRVEILSHCNSGDVTGDRQGVVGYVSAAILRPA